MDLQISDWAGSHGTISPISRDIAAYESVYFILFINGI